MIGLAFRCHRLCHEARRRSTINIGYRGQDAAIRQSFTLSTHDEKSWADAPIVVGRPRCMLRTAKSDIPKRFVEDKSHRPLVMLGTLAAHLSQESLPPMLTLVYLAKSVEGPFLGNLDSEIFLPPVSCHWLAPASGRVATTTLNICIPVS
jgi:hypothetical protein